MKLQGRILANGIQGDDVRLLQHELALLGFRNLPAAETDPGLFGPETLEAVRAFQQSAGLEVTGAVDEPTARAMGEKVAASPDAYTVKGTVTSPERAGVGGLSVAVVDKTVGPDVTLATVLTGMDGRYEAHFAASAIPGGKVRPDLQARVSLASTPPTFLAASEVRYNASHQQTLDVTLPAGAPLPGEYETLTAALAAHYTGKLKDLQESADRQDVTYLANKSGWDARAVAMAALAEQFSQRDALPAPPSTVAARAHATAAVSTGIPPALYYALFRAGLPADPETLYQTDLTTVRQVWQQAVDQGVIPKATASAFPAALDLFQRLAAQKALGSRALAGASTLQELLHLSLGDDTARQQKFVDLYTRHREDLPTFWNEVAKPPAQGGLGPDVAARLQLDGQLATLTLNNAPVISRLYAAQGTTPLTSTLDLARRGYHRADKWAPLLAGATVPDAVPGVTPAEKLAHYAEHLAAQVRLAYPTAVVAERVQSKALPLGVDAATQKGVADFLNGQQGKFELGRHPVAQYLAANPSLKVDPAVVAQVKRLQRIYQITPSDDAMTALLQHKLDSAYAIARFNQADFVRSLGTALGGEENARLVHAKAQQVHNAVLNVATSFLTARRAAPLGANAMFLDPVGPPDVSPSPAQATLETLFGSMDFCACEECRSILSPAAYLVDLLQFLDPPDAQWTPFVTSWQVDHGAPYPFADGNAWTQFQATWKAQHPGQPLPQTAIKPLEILLSRRPDLQHLPLTCENTNTPLPYIDLVNETLEYFVANSLSLTGYTGHDTGDTATPEELLASPQFVLDTVYDNTLKSALFPEPLPFHRALALLRRDFDHFGVPLATAMEVLRKNDALDRAADPGAYGWHDILMERLHLSRRERDLLTDSTLTLQQLYGYDPATSQITVLAGLAKIKAFARRLGVSYLDLVAILKTRFINPSSALIPQLEQLGVPFATLKALKDGKISDTDFDKLLPAGLDPKVYGGDVKKWVRDNYARIMGLLVIANPANSTDLCSFDQLEFRYALPDNSANSLRAIEYHRLLRFLRLWRKLGWTIGETDAAISALYPAADLPTGTDDAGDLIRLGQGFATLLDRLGVAMELLDRLGLAPERDLASLLACWSLLGTHGDDALYGRLFLSSALLQKDPAFAPDAAGNVLTDPNQNLLDHTETLRAACNLTGEELTLILVDLFGLDKNPPPPPPPLTLDNVSAVYRRAWLARTLRLPVRELLPLARSTGLDPFAPPDPPNPPIVRLVHLIEALRAASLSPAQALYLTWNQDLSGASAPPDAEVTAFARTLRTDFAAIEAQFAVIDDPQGDIARARMALVYGAEAVDFFFGLLNDTLSVAVPYSHPQDTLEPAILKASGRIIYDPLHKRLSYAQPGLLMTTAIRDAIKAAYTGPAVSSQVTDAQKRAAVTSFQDAVDRLYAADQAAVAPFFQCYPELQPLYTAYTAPSTDSPATKRATLLAAILPDLKARRKRQQALAAAGTVAHVDAAFAEALLGAPAVLHASAAPGRPALDDLLAVESASPLSGAWSGYLEVPESGSYNFAVVADKTAKVVLTVGGVAVPLPWNSTTQDFRRSSPVSLAAGALVAVALGTDKAPSALRWATTTGRGWEDVPTRYLYPQAVVDPLRGAYVRFLKLVSLATALHLTANEIAYLAASTDFLIAGQGWANALTISGSPDGTTAQALRDVLTALLDFARLKAALAPGDERLLAALTAPIPQQGGSPLLTLTGWDGGSLDALLARFGKTRPDLAHLATLAQTYDAYSLVRTLGIPGAALLAGVTNDPSSATVASLQSGLRARYAEADWLAVVKPINDELRDLARDALVASILHGFAADPKTSAVDTPDKLFEYFLMDVEMAPCMQTSRIRNALSAVQLFVDRCLMDLEPWVAPPAIDAAQWEWRKRFRVWQANREVFLWPENWLEPELRDDASPFFKETLSELLQSDISDDAAAVAFGNYLAKLETVARLEPCGIYYVEADPGQSNDVVHVVARTAGAHRKYYYRRLESGSWTPWEPIQLDIEDTPVIPVVWKGRLFLLWLRILKTTPLGGPSNIPSGPLTAVTGANVAAQAGALQVQVQGILCWSEHHNGKWQPTKTSDVGQPLDLGLYAPSGAASFDRAQLRLRVFEEAEGPEVRLRVNVIGGNKYQSFLLYNTHSLPVQGDVATDRSAPPESRWIPPGSPQLWIENDLGNDRGGYELHVMDSPIDFRAVVPLQRLQVPWDAPFLFADARHAFYVIATESPMPTAALRGFGIPPGGLSPASPRTLLPPGRSSVPDPVRRDGTSTSVRFGSQEIGPAGAHPTGRTQQR